MSIAMTYAKRDRAISSALKKSNRAATVGAVAGSTAIPVRTVEGRLKHMLEAYRGQLQVTESGELLYYFPEGFRDRRKGVGAWFRRITRRSGRLMAKTSSFLFKIWIVVMLVGYFALFVALLVGAVAATIAASVAGRGNGSRSRGRGGFGMFYLTTRIVQTFFYLLVYSGSKQRKVRTGRPLHKSVFAYVFGDGDPNTEWNAREKKAVAAFIQSRKGVVTATEIASLVGRSVTESEQIVHSMLPEFDGQPGVTDEGTIYYEFPRLMEQTSTERFGQPGLARKSLIPFNANEKKINRWITFFNGFNLLFGGYFLILSIFGVAVRDPVGPDVLFLIVVGFIGRVIADPLIIVFVALGIVPVVFSMLFFTVTILRRIRDRARNVRTIRHNFTRRLVVQICDRPAKFVPGSITLSKDERSAKVERTQPELIAEFQRMRDIDIEENEAGKTAYSFGEIDRIQRDMASFRRTIDISKYDVGSVIFDSGTR